jgi:hypothetical protein
MGNSWFIAWACSLLLVAGPALADVAIKSGATSDTLTVDPNTKAARVSVRPLDPGANGAYRFGASTGILPAALGANSEIFQFRWASGTALAVIQRIVISASATTTFFAAGVPVEIDLVKSSGWTVAGTGGTGITPAALLRMRSTFANTALAAGDMRIATTAALGPGTKTLETLSLVNHVVGGPITASLNGTIIAPGTVFYEAEIGDSAYPLVLTQNEGFSIRSVAVPATGTWRLSVNVRWAEVATY